MKLKALCVIGFLVAVEDATGGASLLRQLVKGVKFYEGFRASTYVCAGGKKTIGYGHTGKMVEGGKVSEDEASSYLIQDLMKTRKDVLDVVTVPLEPHQLAALVSFTFNVGKSNLKRLVNGPGRLNDGNYESVAKILPQYRMAGGKVLEGLEKRRAWEVSLWK